MKNNNRIMLIILAVLLITTTIGVFYNRQYVAEKRDILARAQIVISEEGQEIARLSMDDISKLSTAQFSAKLKSSIMVKPEEHSYTGVALAELFRVTGVSMDGKERVMVHSGDGYMVPLTIAEIQALENAYLVFKDNGRYLGSYGDKGGQGPYMLVIKGDRFSQRWAKYVCELDVQ